MEQEKFICQYCGKICKNLNSLRQHEIRCKENPNKYSIDYMDKSLETLKKKFPEKYIKHDYVIKCAKCGKEFTVTCSENMFLKGKYPHYCCKACANSHIVSNETKKKISEGVNKANNVAADKKLNKIVYKTCENCGCEFILPWFKRKNNRIILSHKKYCDDCYKKINAELFAKAGLNNFHAGYYKNIWCDSSWELAFLIYNLEHNKNVKRCTKRLTYVYDDKEHIYIPDFDIDGTLYEIKGFENDKAKIKHNLFPEIVYITKDEITKYLEYVKDKYGDKFWNLYENNI